MFSMPILLFISHTGCVLVVVAILPLPNEQMQMPLSSVLFVCVDAFTFLVTYYIFCYTFV